jgi:hypothetical protein
LERLEEVKPDQGHPTGQTRAIHINGGDLLPQSEAMGLFDA